MPGFNPDKINIHELAIEDPEKQAELPFDVERDITPEDWEGMENGLQKIRNWDRDDKWGYFSHHAMCMKILDSNIDLGLDQDSRDGLIQHLRTWDSIDTNLKWSNLPGQAVCGKILYPDMDLGFDANSWQEMSKKLQVRRERGSWDDFADYAMEIKILNPKMDIKLSENDWEGMENILEDFRRKGLWGSFADHAQAMKILNPNVELNLDRAAWQGMRMALEKSREEGQKFEWRGFSSLAFAMKIIAAEKVEITDEGLRLTMPEKKSLQSETPPIPETKQF
jgi:hypothetical protein